MPKHEHEEGNQFVAGYLDQYDRYGRYRAFVVMTIVIQTVGSNLFLWAWVFGAVTAMVDGMIWSELGAAYPLAGGSYNFLKEAYGPKAGR